MKIKKEDLWLAIEIADDDLGDGAFWAMVSDILECDVMDVIDAIAEHGSQPPDEED